MADIKLFLIFSLFVVVYSKNLCIDGFYEKDGLCWACSPNCETCDGPNEDSCTRCPKHSRRWGLTFEDLVSGNSFLCSNKEQKDMVSITESHSKCSTGKFFDEEIDMCVPCHPTCRSCLGSGPQNCSSCLEDQFASSGNKDAVGVSTFSCQPRCYNEGRKLGEFSECSVVSKRKARRLTDIDSIFCGPGEYLKDFQCHPCPENCTKCNGDGCLACSRDFFAQVYVEELKSKYVNCTRKCSGMSVTNSDGSKTCLLKKPCKKGYYKDDNYNCIPCSSECETCDNTGKCTTYKCDASCGSCTGPSIYNCTTCAPGHYKMNMDTVDTYVFECVKECPNGYYESKRSCILCPHQCSSCKGGGFYSCTSCAPGYFIFNGGYNTESQFGCVNACPFNSYKAYDGCRTCYYTCSTCDGAGSRNCTSCKSGQLRRINSYSNVGECETGNYDSWTTPSDWYYATRMLPQTTMTNMKNTYTILLLNQSPGLTRK